MVFSSTVFLFQFLPCCLFVYFTVAFATRRLAHANGALIAISLIFYFVGSGVFVLLLLASIAGNYYLGHAIAAAVGPHRKALLTGGIVANVGVLIYFKYANFFVNTFAGAAQLAGWQHAAPALIVALPVGISFYTFMAVSYIVDVYAGRGAAGSFSNFAVYLSLFPHLVAGPIVRFSELRAEIASRTMSADLFLDGMFRFAMGLARKAIIADSLAEQADKIFNLPAGALTPAVAWLGMICYAFEIFYDFSGYTDMALGLAKMLGFHFPENFNQPYSASNVTEFWRRWHMTLTRWFRDYLYIPLGGNRRGYFRTYVNLFAVFVLCGLWHGAAWTFVFWGVYHGCLLVAERLAKQKYHFEMSGPAGVLVTFYLVSIGWIFFRSATIADAFHFLAVLNSFQFDDFGFASLARYSPLSTASYLVIAALFAFAPPDAVQRFMPKLRIGNMRGVVAIGLFILSVAYIAEGTFRPFIYFRF